MVLLNSINEWDKLKSVIVGSATNAHWPVKCPDFRKLEQTTAWKETPVPKGPVQDWIIQEANEDLEYLCQVLKSLRVDVYRPTDIHFETYDGMYNYCPRDRMLVYGSKAYSVPMMFKSRMIESAAYSFIPQQEIKSPHARFDAANICRIGEELLYLISESGNLAGYMAVMETLGKRVHPVRCYSGVHIDSTIVPIREGLVMLNADRVCDENMPKPLKDWDKIWIEKSDIVEHPFYEYPYASNWIAMNLLMVTPNLAICDPKQTAIRRKLDAWGVESIGVELRHSRTLGGGHHCVTLDLEREAV